MSFAIRTPGGVAGALAIVGLFSTTPVLAQSTAAEIRNCADENWCSYHRTVDQAWRYSPLKQITKDNVSQLAPAWMFMPGEGRMGMQSTPIVMNGMMYVSTTPSTVWALDAKTGERVWSYKPELDQAVVSRSFFAHTRGLTVGDGRVYMGTTDGHLVALDEKTGKEVWKVQLVDSAKASAGFSGAGTFVSSDLLVIGQNGGEYPVEGKIFGIDPKTGKSKWTFYTTGRNDEAALATWGNDSWKYGGGGSWQPGTVDYKNNQILLGVGNPNPDYDYCGDKCMDVNADGHRPGSNLYTSSTVALDLDTGKLKWYFQEAPSDPYDYDASVGEYVIIDDKVVHPGKNGFMHINEIKSGKPLNVYPAMKNQNWTSGFNKETGQWENVLWPKAGEKTLVCPAIDGGHSWNAGSYDPNSKTFFRVVNEWCMWLTVNPKEGATPTAGSEERIVEPFAQVFMAADWKGTNPPNDTMHGRLVARDPISGKVKWEKRYDVIPHSALLTTGSGLLFNGTYEGYLEAMDSETGEVLWQFNNGTGHNGGIISYAVDGEQYIAAAVGHGSYVGRAVVDGYKKDNPKLASYEESAAIVVYKLPK